MHINLSHSQNRTDSNSVGDFVKTIVDAYTPELHQNSIALETDFEPVTTPFNGDLVRSVTKSLIENAIDKMPNGGVISLTLIDGNHQWELEVADSNGMAFNRFPPIEKESEGLSQQSPTSSDLPKIIPFPESESLRRAQSAALNHGAQIQTWDCPQGGTAHVFVAPKKRSNNRFVV